MKDYLEVGLKVKNVNKENSVTTPEQMRIQIENAQRDSSLINKVFEYRRYGGLSGEDTYTLLAYHALIDMQKYYEKYTECLVTKPYPEIISTSPTTRDLSQLQDFGEELGCPPGINIFDFIRHKLKFNNVPKWLEKLTFQVEYNPNCIQPYLVRLCSKGTGQILGNYQDSIGYGKTLEEAALNAERDAIERNSNPPDFP